MMLIVLFALFGATGSFFVLPSGDLMMSIIVAISCSNLMGLAAACVIAVHASLRPMKNDKAPAFPAELQIS